MVVLIRAYWQLVGGVDDGVLDAVTVFVSHVVHLYYSAVWEGVPAGKVNQ